MDIRLNKYFTSLKNDLWSGMRNSNPHLYNSWTYDRVWVSMVDLNFEDPLENEYKNSN